MRKIPTPIIILSAILFLLIYFRLFLPKGFGSWFAYSVSRVYSDERFTIPPDLEGYMIIIKSVMLITDRYDFPVFNIMAIFGILLSFISYIILLKRLFTRSNSSIVLYAILPIILFPVLLEGYVLGVSLPLIVIVLFSVIMISQEKSAREFKILYIIFYFALSFIWHSAFGVTFSILLAFYILLPLYKERWKMRAHVPIFLVGVYFITYWLYILKDTSRQIILSTVNIDIVHTMINAIKFKGNLAYQYAYILPEQSSVINTLYIVLLYANYTFSILYSAWASIKLLLSCMPLIKNRTKCSFSEFVMAACFFSAIIFMFIYLLGSGTVAPFIIIAFLVPMLYASISTRKTHALRNTIPRAAAYFILLTIAIGLLNTHIDVNSSAEWNIPSESQELNCVGEWVFTRWSPVSDMAIYSDAFTFGNMVWRVAQKRYNGERINETLKLASVDYKVYDELVKGIMHQKVGYVDNLNIYNLHLKYDSLYAWSEFEPIHPSVLENSSNIIYDSGNYRVMTGRL